MHSLRKLFTWTTYAPCATSTSRSMPIFCWPWWPIRTPSSLCRMATQTWISWFSEKLGISCPCSGVGIRYPWSWSSMDSDPPVLEAREARSSRCKLWKSHIKCGLPWSRVARVKARLMKPFIGPFLSSMGHAFTLRRSSMLLSRSLTVHSLWHLTQQQLN